MTGTKKTTLGQNKNWQTGPKNMSPNLEWWAGCGPASGWAPKGGRTNLEKVGSRRMGAPKGGPRKVGTQGWRPRRWGAQTQKGGAPKGGGPKISRFFFLPRHNFLSSLSWGSFRGILVGFLKGRGPEISTFGVLGLSCTSPGGPVWWGRRGFTRPPENSKRAHLSAPALLSPPKFHERTPQEREERMKIVAEREKKSAKFWAVRRRGPAEGRSRRGLSGAGRGSSGKWGERTKHNTQHTTTHNNTQQHTTKQHNTQHTTQQPHTHTTH